MNTTRKEINGIEHIVSSVHVYFTRDYARFKSLTGNRKLNDQKVKKIIKDIQSGTDMLRYCPILVNEKMEVIDGQHRLEVAKTIGSNVWYIITGETSLPEVAKINSRSEQWKSEDYIKCYSDLGNKNYQVLRRFLKKYPIAVSAAVGLLHYGIITQSGSKMEMFREGEFIVSHFEKAERLMEEVMLFSFFDGYLQPKFIQAIEMISAAGLVDIKELAEKAEKYQDRLERRVNPKEYLRNLEDIYNISARVRKIIYQ